MVGFDSIQQKDGSFRSLFKLVVFEFGGLAVKEERDG